MLLLFHQNSLQLITVTQIYQNSIPYHIGNVFSFAESPAIYAKCLIDLNRPKTLLALISGLYLKRFRRTDARPSNYYVQ